MMQKRKGQEMLYLMTHSIHFYLWLFGIGHMTKDYLDNEEKPVAAISNYQQVIFYMHYLTDRTVYPTAFVTPVL